MDPQLVGYVELLRGVHGAEHVHTGTPATTGELESIERDLAIALPDEYKAVAASIGSLSAGDPPALVIHGVGALQRVHVGTEDIVPLVRLEVSDEPTRTVGVAASGELRAIVDDVPTAVTSSFRVCLLQVMQAAVEAKVDAAIAAAPADFIDDTPGVGQATLQMHAVPPAVMAVLKKEPALADEISLYTSLDEFREQTIHWEKTARPTDTRESKEMVRRMRSLLKQPGIAKLKELVGDSVDLIQWADAIVLCFGEKAPESLALRGSTKCPSDGTDKLSLLWISEVRQVAAVIGDSEQRLRKGYRPDVLRARSLYDVDAPNEAAFLEELCALWSNVIEGIRDAAAKGYGWLIRRTDG